MQNLIEISSEEFIDDTNANFKVIAGPGAGKTHWLVAHIKNVLRNSNRINRVSKIACISYTTVASNEIKMRLQESGDKVECSTIHSFLYNNIVKPYAYLCSEELDFEKIDGHDEHMPSFGFIKIWLEKFSGLSLQNQTFLLYQTNTQDLINFFADLNWQFTGNDLVLTPQNRWKGVKIKFPITKVKCFKSYKCLYWEEGALHHEDVLYFAYNILRNYPILREFISSKFPFIFIDEFQDTNPIQTQIIKWLEFSGSKIGVIGDIAQSIYKFQGAVPEQFKNFESSNQQNFIIKGNRRSTQSVIDFLNHLQKAFRQEKIRKDNFDCPVIVTVGGNHRNNVDRAVNHIKFGIQKDNIKPRILVRNNDLVTQIKKELDHKPNDIWSEFNNVDNSSGRTRCLYSLFTGFQYALQQRFDDSVRAILKIFSSRKGQLREPLKGIIEGELRKKGISLELLEHFISQKANMLKKRLIEFYNEDFVAILTKYEISISKINRAGKPKTFFENHSVKELFDNLRIKEDNDDITTIHNSKGAEFDTVGVCFEEENYIRYILEPDLEHDEESRIYYVAFSRAKDHLILSFSSLSAKNREKLQNLKLVVI